MNFALAETVTLPQKASHWPNASTVIFLGTSALVGAGVGALAGSRHPVRNAALGAVGVPTGLFVLALASGWSP